MEVAGKLRTASKASLLQHRGLVAAASLDLSMLGFRDQIIGIAMGVVKHPKSVEHWIALRSRYLQFWGGYVLRHMTRAAPAQSPIETFPQYTVGMIPANA